VSAQVGPQWRIAQAERMRAAMGSEFCAIADSLREQFGARLTFLKTPELVIGMPPGGEPIGERSLTIEQRRRGEL
jgi:hypothetical protein